MARRRNQVMAVALGVVGVAVLVVALLWMFQRSLVFLPDTSAPGSGQEVVNQGQDITLRTDDGLELGAWLLSPAPEADRNAAVLYAPGNAGHRGARVGIGRELTARGFTVLLMDYRGFGGNPGSPSEDGLARDAVAAAEALKDQGFSAEQTLYVGESIGTGVVARLQSTHPPAGVLLRSPFPEFTDVASEHYSFLPVGLLLRDRFVTSEHVRDSTVPFTVLHGSADEIVPSELSAEVAETVGDLHAEIVFEGVGHNDAEMFGAQVADAVADLADHVME